MYGISNCKSGAMCTVIVTNWETTLKIKLGHFGFKYRNYTVTHVLYFNNLFTISVR